MQDMNAFNLQLQCIYNLNTVNKTLNTDIWNYLKNKINVHVQLKPPVGGSKSLLISESLRVNRII